MERWLGVDNMFDNDFSLARHLEQALKAEVLYHRDRDYVVKDGEVVIVDEFTGRLMPGRRWSEGLHQAVEAKEGVKIQSESQTLATITFQNYFRMYDKLAGMTGTAETEAEEFAQDLQPRGGRHPDQPSHGPRRLRRPRLPQPEGQVERRCRRDRGGARAGPTGPGGHRQRRDQRDALRACSSGAGSSTTCSTRSSTSARRRSSPRPAARTPSPSPPTWPVAAPTSCWAVTPRCSPPSSSTSAASTSWRPRRRSMQAALEEAERVCAEDKEKVLGGRRPAHRGHRAPRGAPHRQPAPRPRRPPGRPGQQPLLPVARGRPDASLRERAREQHHGAPRLRRRHGPRVGDGEPHDRGRPDARSRASTSTRASTSSSTTTSSTASARRSTTSASGSFAPRASSTTVLAMLGEELHDLVTAATGSGVTPATGTATGSRPR